MLPVYKGIQRAVHFPRGYPCIMGLLSILSINHIIIGRRELIECFALFMNLLSFDQSELCNYIYLSISIYHLTCIFA